MPKAMLCQTWKMSVSFHTIWLHGWTNHRRWSLCSTSIGCQRTIEALGLEHLLLVHLFQVNLWLWYFSVEISTYWSIRISFQWSGIRFHLISRNRGAYGYIERLTKNKLDAQKQDLVHSLLYAWHWNDRTPCLYWSQPLSVESTPFSTCQNSISPCCRSWVSSPVHLSKLDSCRMRKWRCISMSRRSHVCTIGKDLFGSTSSSCWLLGSCRRWIVRPRGQQLFVLVSRDYNCELDVPNTAFTKATKVNKDNSIFYTWNS